LFANANLVKTEKLGENLETLRKHRNLQYLLKLAILEKCYETYQRLKRHRLVQYGWELLGLANL